MSERYYVYDILVNKKDPSDRHQIQENALYSNGVRVLWTIDLTTGEKSFILDEEFDQYCKEVNEEEGGIPGCPF